MIAPEEGVAQGPLYNYFDGKEDLLRALFVQSMRDVRESFASGEGGASPRRQLELLIRRSFEILQRNVEFWKLSYGVRMQPAVLEGLGEELQAWTEFIRHTLEAHLRAAGVEDPEIEAAILFALIDGISQHYTLEPERYPLDAVVSKLVEKYCGAGGQRQA